jgi:acetyl esterase/lipase
MAQRSEVTRSTSKRASRMLAILGLLLMVAAVGALPASAAVKTAPAVDGVAYGPLPEQLLDVHLPTGSAGPLPVMIYVHSGGWVAGSRSFIPDFLLAQVDRGIALVSIDYRLVTTAPDGSFVNGFPIADTDVDRAVRFVKAHASTWNLDPRHVMLAGASAGGHLAALAAAAPGVFVDPALPADLAAVSPRVQGVLDFVGVSDFSTFGAAGGWAPELMTKFLDCPVFQVDLCDPAKVAAASIAPHLEAGAPPAFLAYGGTDGLVVSTTQGIPLAQAWARARGDSDPEPTWTRGVSFQQTASGHNIDAAQLDVDEMQTWIAAVTLSPPPAARLAARRTR